MKRPELGIVADVNQDYSLINPTMRPEEIRPGDPLECVVKIGRQNEKVSLWSYCPFGFEFVGDEQQDYKIGEDYEFSLSIGRTTIDLEGSVVFTRSVPKVGTVVGVRINYSSKSNRAAGEDRRMRSRWDCPDHLLPTGTTPNPSKFNDFIFFRVIDVSSNGLKIATSLRNKLLGVGQILECTLSVPMVGTLCTTLKIHRVAIERVQDKDQLVLGATFVKFDDITSSTLSEYLLTFGRNCSVKSLRDAGFRGHFGSSQFDFSYSKSARDYEDVLKLRLEAYQASGKLSDDVDLEFMRDEFDSRSRILTVRLNGELIGSARAMFHEIGDKTSHERYLSYPPDFPQITECLEVSRVCVNPGYQGAGLARELAKHLALLTVKAGRKYIFLSAAEGLIDFWKDLGFRETGITYVHKQLGNLDHKLLVNDVQKSILGRGISSRSWIDSYQHLYGYCTEYGLVNPSALDIMRLQAMRAIGKLK